MRHIAVSGLLLLAVVVAAEPASARLIEIFPSSADVGCNEEFENVANTLQPGDELVLHGGTYTQTCRRAIENIHGTAASPIVIRAATDETPVIRRPINADFNFDQNNIEISSVSYLTIRGLTFRGGDTGVRFMGTVHHVIFEDNEIFETGNNAIAMNSGNSDAMIFRRNHIHHTGLLSLAIGTTEGEGIYAGSNSATYRVTNSLIENNYIHHTRSTSGGGNDGIEIKPGSAFNTIRNNVIHDTTIGTRFPCIFVYGGGAGRNIVEGNVMWNCGEAIQVVSDAVIQNNIVLTSDIGLTAASHADVAGVQNVTIVNNTFYNHGTCLNIRWASATNMIFANNAVYCPSTTAVSASFGTAVVRSNYVTGPGVTPDNSRFFAGGTVASAFVDADGRNLWPAPGSVLRDAADASLVPQLDFNGSARTVPSDVGAYETEGLASNPGWQVVPGIKPSGGNSPAPPPSPPPVTPMDAFVGRFYTEVLGRMPDPAGAAQWVSFLTANCNAAGLDAIARGFFDSLEFRTQQPLSVNGLVRRLYGVFMNREPEQAGADGWAALIRNARLAVALRGFIGSAEFRSLLPDRTNRTAVTALVTRFYQQILLRPPETTGLAAWVDYIVTSRDLEGAALSFLASAEFEARPLTARDYVTILYQVLLDRQPEAAGVDAWEAVLRDNLMQIINIGFVPSPEFQGLLSTLCAGSTTLLVADSRGMYADLPPST